MTKRACAGCCATSRSLAAPADLPVAIERPDGIVVERLLAAGHVVVPVHPNAFHAARLRWGAGRAKSDPADSYMLADYLRTDGHRLRRLRPLDSITRELQALVRMRDDHVDRKAGWAWPVASDGTGWAMALGDSVVVLDRAA